MTLGIEICGFIIKLSRQGMSSVQTPVAFGSKGSLQEIQRLIYAANIVPDDRDEVDKYGLCLHVIDSLHLAF